MKGMHTCGKNLFLFHFFYFISRYLASSVFYVSNFCKTFLQRFAFNIYLQFFFILLSFCSFSLGYTIFSCRFPFHTFSSSYCCYCCFFFLVFFILYSVAWYGSRVYWLDPTFTKRVAVFFCCCLPHLFHTLIFEDGGGLRLSVCLDFCLFFGCLIRDFCHNKLVILVKYWS